MAARRYLMRGGIVFIGILIIWVVYLSSKQLSRNQRIENEVSKLQDEADKIRRENETLGEKINYFSSDNFREQEAKEKLGLKKIDEEVVVVRVLPEMEVQKKERKKVAPEEVAYPNYRKWLRLFWKDF